MRSVPLALVFATVPLLAACKIDLDHADTADAAGSNSGRNCPMSTATACVNATQHSDFTFIKSSIFPLSCSASTSCHKDSTSSGKLDLSPANAYTALLGADGMGVTAHNDSTHKLVVPGHPEQSYLYFMIHGIPADMGNPPFPNPPANVGFMPQNNGNQAICCQKLDAIERWITAGAMND